MLIERTDPKGIDVAIQAIQSQMHERLLALWGIDSSSFKCYGRCYRNRTSDGYVAEVYVGNNEYQEVYHDDSLKASCFFGITNPIEIDTINRADIHLVFFVNLATLKPLSVQRADEEVRSEVVSVLDGGLFHSTVTSVEMGIEGSLREYRGSLRDDRLKFVDMHPVHCFRIDLEIEYENINTCNSFSNI